MSGLQLQSHLAAEVARFPSFLSPLTTIDVSVSRHCKPVLSHSSESRLTTRFSSNHSFSLRGTIGGRKNLISLVDDDESIRRTTTLLIESFGFHAAAFESAESFLKSGQLHETSVSSLTFRCRGMNGLQLQSHLAAAGYKIPIIFITAYDNKESRQRACKPAPSHS